MRPSLGALYRSTLQTTRKRHLLVAGVNPFAAPRSDASAVIHPNFTKVEFQDEWLASVRAECKDAEILGISSGYGHSMISYLANGEEQVFAVGRNESGQLGLGFNSQEPTRGLVTNFSGTAVTAIATSLYSSHMLLAQEDDTHQLLSFGSNNRGQLGIPRIELASRPTAIKDDTNFIDIKAGFEHALALSEDGFVYASGIGTDGQQGSGKNNDQTTFSRIATGIKAQKIFAGGDTSGFLSTDGELYTWGNSEYAQAGHSVIHDQLLKPTHVDTSFLGQARVVDFAIGGSFALILDDLGRVFSCGYGAIGQGKLTLSCVQPLAVPGLEDIRSIYASYGGAFAVRTDDKLFGFGLNTHRRLGLGEELTHVYSPTSIDLPVGGRIRKCSLTNDTSWIVVEEQ